MCRESREYLTKIIYQMKNMLGCKSRVITLPLVKGGHPVFDSSEALVDEVSKSIKQLLDVYNWQIDLACCVFDHDKVKILCCLLEIAPGKITSSLQLNQRIFIGDLEQEFLEYPDQELD